MNKKLCLCLFIFLSQKLFAVETSKKDSALKLTSEYTSIAEKDCKKLSAAPENEVDAYEGLCPGKQDYTVLYTGGDARYTLKLKYKEKVIDLTHFVVFHEPGSSKIEWLFESEPKGQKKYRALIFRLKITQLDEKSRKEKPEQMLVVVKLDGEKSCTVAHVKSSPKMNEAAKEQAAKVDQLKCME